eukprot:CFRG2757T1
MDLANALRAWVASLKGAIVTVAAETLDDLRDGVALSEIMCEVEPEVLPKEDIRYNVNGNPTVMERNLSAVANAVEKYFDDYLFLDVLEGADTTLISDTSMNVHDDEVLEEMIKLMKGVLGAAVQCPDKQRYIQGIMKLESSVQSQLMEVIQRMMQRFEEDGHFSDLTTKRQQSTGSSHAISSSELMDLRSKIELLEEEKEKTSQKIEDLENRLREANSDAKKEVEEEMDSLLQQVQKITDQYEDSEREKEELGREIENANRDKEAQIRKLTRECEKEKQTKEKKLLEIQALKDENDQLAIVQRELSDLKSRDTANREKTIAIVADLKDTNEQHVKEIESLKSQKLQKKNQTGANEERMRKLETELEEAQEAMAEAKSKADDASELAMNLTNEKEDLERTIRRLEDHVRELEYSTTALHGRPSLAENMVTPTLKTAIGTDSAVVTLQEENKSLKLRLKNVNSKAKAKVSELDAKVAELEAKLASGDTGGDNVAGTSVNSAREINELLMEKNKLQSDLLQVEATIKEHVLQNQHLQRMLENEINQGVGKDYEEKVLSMQNELIEKDRQITEIKQSAEQEISRMEIEMQLMTTAWFNLGCSVQKQNRSDRTGSTGQRSFLQKQRDALTTKSSVATSSRR